MIFVTFVDRYNRLLMNFNIDWPDKKILLDSKDPLGQQECCYNSKCFCLFCMLNKFLKIIFCVEFFSLMSIANTIVICLNYLMKLLIQEMYPVFK